MNLDGELVLLKSGRGLSRPKISRFIMKLGQPVMLASDKHPAPRFLERLASAFSAVISYPEGNVSRLEKARAAKGFGERNPGMRWKNQHEKDALVAVLFAWKRVGGLMDRVDAKLKGFRGRDDFGQLKGFVKSGVILRQRSIDFLLRRFLKDEQ